MENIPAQLGDDNSPLVIKTANNRTTGVYAGIEPGGYVVHLAHRERGVVLLNVQNVPQLLAVLQSIDTDTPTQTIGRRYVSYIGETVTDKAIRHTSAFHAKPSGTQTCEVCGTGIEAIQNTLFIHECMIHAECIDDAVDWFTDVWAYTDIMLSDEI